MGGSSGGIFSREKPEELARKVREVEQKAKSVAFETELAGRLNQLLASYNDRNTELVKSRLDEIISSIEKDIEGNLETFFGGSVSKHTYVDGLSDIDSILLINKSELIEESPPNVIRYVARILSKNLSEYSSIEPGRLAVTVKYSDGMEIQLLPGIQTKEGLKIASSDGQKWSKIDPRGFSNALSKWNKRCNNKLVPTIKLVKAINDQFPENLKLEGYHIESLAIKAFKSYSGPKNVVSMIPHFFEKSKELVKSSISDKTGQSIHVDDYLGENNSQTRMQVSHLLNRVSIRMKNATAANSFDQWLSLFGE